MLMPVRMVVVVVGVGLVLSQSEGGEKLVVFHFVVSPGLTLLRFLVLFPLLPGGVRRYRRCLCPC